MGSGLLTITATEARGRVAVASPVDALCVVLGCASGSATTKISPFYLSGTAAQAGEGYGDAVDTLAQIIEQRGVGGNKVPAALCVLAADASTPGSYGTIVTTGVTGTSAVTVDSSSHPYGTYQVRCRVLTGCTIGVSGGQIQWSLDNGNTYQLANLGTASSLTIPGSNVKFNFAAGTLVAGDTWTVTTTAPAPGTADVTAGFAALAASSLDFGLVCCDFPMTAAIAAVVTAGLDALAAVGKRAAVIGRTALPTSGQAEAQWMAAVSAAFLTVNDDRIHLRATYGLLTDALTSRKYLRSDLAQFTADTVRVRRSVYPDAPADREMANFSLVDSNLALVGHDEGPRGTATGLSNTSLGNRFGCNQRLPDVARRENVYSTVPWMLAPADSRIRHLMARRIANALERTALSAGATSLGANVRYTPATQTTPATLTQLSRVAVQGIIFSSLKDEFALDIQNANDADVDAGLVQVNPVITVSDGGLVRLGVTLAPLMFGTIVELNLTLSVQE